MKKILIPLIGLFAALLMSVPVFSQVVPPPGFIPEVTFANLPVGAVPGTVRFVTNTDGTACNDSGAAVLLCRFDGVSWVIAGSGGSGAGAHAASHQHGGADEIASATPAANTIPKTSSDTFLASGWTNPLHATLSGSGAPSAGICTVVGGQYTDTATGKIWTCPAAGSTDAVDAAGLVPIIDQISDGSASETCEEGDGAPGPDRCTAEFNGDGGSIEWTVGPKVGSVIPINGKLAGDSATPGNSKYYGTDGSGNKGYHDLPEGGGGGVAPVIRPYSSVPVTAGMVYSKIYNSEEELMHVTTATLLTSNAIWRLRFQMPQALPSGTAKVRVIARANAATGVVKFDPKWCSAAVGESSCTVQSESTQTMTWSTGNEHDRLEAKITLDADTVVAAEIIEMDFTFVDTDTTLAVESGWLVSIIWE